MKSQTTVCPDCKGRGYTESMEGHHLVCTCYYERQEASSTTAGPLTVEAVARIPNHDNVLAVYFSRDPTDAELTAIHDAIWRIVNEG